MKLTLIRVASWFRGRRISFNHWSQLHWHEKQALVMDGYSPDVR